MVWEPSTVGTSVRRTYNPYLMLIICDSLSDQTTFSVMYVDRFNDALLPLSLGAIELSDMVGEFEQGVSPGETASLERQKGPLIGLDDEGLAANGLTIQPHHHGLPDLNGVLGVDFLHDGAS